MAKSDKIRNLKPFIAGYAKAPHGARVVQRQFGHQPTGKTYQAEFAHINGSGRVVYENKAVRETQWRNPALALALLEAAHG